MHKLICKLFEFQNLPEVKEADVKTNKVLISKLYESMTSAEKPNPTAERLKELVKKKSPKEFVCVYMREFKEIYNNFISLRPIIRSSMTNVNKNQKRYDNIKENE
jgi:hypothetical protein